MSAIKSDKPAKSKSRSKRSGPESRLKVVVRRLPPNLPETIFWDSVAPWVDAQTSSWKTFHKGKLRPKGDNKENVFSRAYIVFNTEEQIKNFHRDYDGHLFRDKSGNESQAVVEYAPFQKIPSTKGKVDQRQGTIQDDEDFKSFLDSLNQVEPTEADKLAMAPPPDFSDKTTTPLLASLLPKEKPAEKTTDKHQDTRTGDKPASSKTRRRKEKEQASKEAQEDAEFSRAPIVRLETTRHIEEQPKKGQAKERSGNANPKNPTRKASEAGDTTPKPKGGSGGGKTPASPIRTQKSKPPASSGPSQPPIAEAEEGATPTQQKARPKFKFDGILAGGGARQKGGRSDSAGTVVAMTSPTTETAGPSEGSGTQPSSRKGRKGKEKERDSSAAKGAAHAESSAGKGADTGSAKPPAAPIRILQRPVARIDDDGAIPDSPTTQSPTSIQMPGKSGGRGRGGGGGRGRGRGRGRGGAPPSES